MNQLDIKKVANSVTEEPIEIIITREPKGWVDTLLVRLKIRSLKRSFFVKPPSLRMVYKITSLFMDIQIHKRDKEDFNDWTNEMINSNTRKMAEIVATYFHGCKSPVPESLIDYVMENMTMDELDYVTSLMKSQIDVVPFINSISSIRSLDLISPSLTEESLANTGEIIAPGVLSGVHKNTSGLG